MKQNSFSGEEHENPSHHLTFVKEVGAITGPKNVPEEFLLLKLFRWSLKDKAFRWLQSLPRNTIASWKDCIREFLARFNPFHKTMQDKQEIANFSQRPGESFAQAWRRFSESLSKVPNHGFGEKLVIQYFYGGLNDDAKQMVDLCAGGTLNMVTYDDAIRMFSERATNDEQYNPQGEVASKKGMFVIPPEIMPEVKRSMKEKGIPAELAIENKVDVLQTLIEEDKFTMEITKCRHQQLEFRKHLTKHLELNRKGIQDLSEILNELGHANKHLDKHLDMIQIQCDQIAKAQATILSQKDFSATISTNIVTRRGTETQEPEGPPWYQEEQVRKKKEVQKMAQEESDLVDSQDDIDLEEQRKNRIVENNLEEQDDTYNSDAETVDPREDSKRSREQEEVEIISKEKQLERQKARKKKAKEPEPPPKEKSKVIPYPHRRSEDYDKHLYDSFAEALGKLRLELPLAEAIQVPPYKKFIRDVLNRKKKIITTVAIMTSYGDKLPAKLGDPGVPTITCAIGKTHIHNALCDLGAGVSVMPFALYKKIGSRRVFSDIYNFADG